MQKTVRLLAPTALLLALVGTSVAALPAAAPVAAPAVVAQAPEAAIAAPVVAAPAVAPAPAAVETSDVEVPEMVVEAIETEPAAAPELIAVEGLKPEVLSAALQAVADARARGIQARNDLLTVIDYSLPSTEPRLWVLDLERGEVLFHELVAHGKGTGEKFATRFSNTPDSRQTSLGLYLTAGTYVGSNGYSLRLEGLYEGINDRAMARAIVMHGAWYVSPEQARAQGRIGRSWGCPALSEKIARPVIDTIKGGSFIFSYHPELIASGAPTPATARAAR